MEIARQIERLAKFKGNDEFLVTDRDERVTFAQFDEQVQRVANALGALGTTTDDKVGILASNTLEHLLFFYGSIRRGVTVVPLNFRGGDPEITHQINHDGVSALFVGEDYTDTLARIRDEISVRHVIVDADVPDEASDLIFPDWIREVSPAPQRPLAIDIDHISVLYHTGGTTGVPKTVPWKAGDVETNTKRLGFDLQITADDVLMLTTPLFHIGSALFGTVLAPYTESKLVLLDDFSVEKTLTYIEREAVTHVLFVPSMMRAILTSDVEHSRYDLTSVRKISFTGENLDDETRAQVMSVFPEAGVWNVYGATEVGSCLSCRPTVDQSENVIGYPFADREVTIRDDGQVVDVGQPGEIWIRGERVPDGYYGNEEMTTQRYRNGESGDWYSTGDVGYIDDRGFVHYAGRLDDRIIRGGENIFPSEIEEVLLGHDAIDEAVAFGIDHEVLGESVAVAIVVTADTGDVTTATIQEWCHEKLAPYKIPEKVEVLARLPRTDAGKFDRKALQDAYGANTGGSHDPT